MYFYLSFISFLSFSFPLTPCFSQLNGSDQKITTPGYLDLCEKGKNIYEMVSRWKYIMKKIATLLFKRENI